MKKRIQNKRPQDNPGTSLKKENTYNVKKGRVKWKTLTTRKEALWGYYLCNIPGSLFRNGHRNRRFR